MDAGSLPSFPNANSAHQLNQQQLQQIQQQAPSAKVRDSIQRFKKRFKKYRQRHEEYSPLFEHTFSEACEQQSLETVVLQKRFIENKAKKAAKKADKKQPENATLSGSLASSVHVGAQQKFALRRPLDDGENVTDNYEPPHKLAHTNNGEDLKFSVQIVQKVEFTAALSQTQQISTNVTVKALTNTSVKNEPGIILRNRGNNNQHDTNNCVPNLNGQHHGQQQTTSPTAHTSDLTTNHSNIECKQEPDSEYGDLEQCMSALEKDVAANGGHFPILDGLIGDDTIDNSDTFKDIFSDLNDFPNADFFSSADLPFNKKRLSSDIKTEDCKPDMSGLDNLCVKQTNNVHNSFGQSYCENQMNNNIHKQQQQQQQQQQQHQHQQQQRNTFNACNVPNNGPSMCELSPAQTLKQMAEQHQQHKNTMGMPFVRAPMTNNPAAQQVNLNRNNAVNSQSFGNDFGQFNGADFMNNTNKNLTSGGNQFEIVTKQEMLFTQQQQQPQQQQQQQQQQAHHMPQMPNKLNPNAFNKQPFAPRPNGNNGVGMPTAHNNIYPGSPNSMQLNHANISTNFMTGRNNMPHRPQIGQPNQNHGPAHCNPNPNGQTTTTLHMKQTQQLHINQHGPNSPGIHVSAGQHMHLNGDLKNNVSVAAQQGIFFNHTNKAQPQNVNMNGGPGCNSNVNNPNNSQSSHAPQPNNNSQNVPNETYSVSQSQVINFTHTQQQSQNQVPSAQNPQNRSLIPNAGNVNVNVMNPNSNMSMNIPSQNPVNLPQSMTQNSVAAGGNPIQNMTAMHNPMGMNMNSHNAMMASSAVMQQQQRQQQQQQQQQHQRHQMMRAQAMNRPPPPDYKGAMMRPQPNMYMQQQHNNQQRQIFMQQANPQPPQRHQMFMQHGVGNPLNAASQRMPVNQQPMMTHDVRPATRIIQNQNHNRTNVHMVADKMPMNNDWRPQQQQQTTMMAAQNLHFNDNTNALEIFDNLTGGDASNFSAQDLLSSLDNENFNFQDMLH